MIKTLKLFLSLLLIYPIAGLIPSDGECHTFVFLPFTILGEFDAGSLYNWDYKTNYGHSQMAAALLAAEHFNERNPIIVPELSSSEFTSCNVQLRIDNTSFFDTGTYTKMASQQLHESGVSPCGIVGPFNDDPALELSTMAQAARFPIVVHRAFDLNIASSFANEFSSLVFPDLLEGARNLVSYLRHIGRTNYIGILYSLSDVNFQRREVLSFQLDENGMDYFGSAYVSPQASGAFATEERSPLEALRRIKERGYRTIVVAMGQPFGELQAIADAAEELGMNDGNYFWVWYDAVDLEVFFQENENTSKIVYGSVWMAPIGDILGFEDVWHSQGKAEVDRLNAANPIRPNEPGYFFAEDDFFQTEVSEYGSDFIYDAVMALGLGACRAEREADGTVSGRRHLEGIRNVSFFGATGPVEFGNNDGDLDRLGARKPDAVAWATFNFLPPPIYANLTDFLVPSWLVEEEEPLEWLQWEPVIYADGTTNPPPLSDDFEMNYIGAGIRVLGLAMMAIAMFGAVASSVFVFVRRKHRVLAASQPPFLYLLCFGSFLAASGILTISFDEGAGWSENQLSKACKATPWLVSQGLIIIYGSLFTKMWRVHKLLQFRKRRVGIRGVILPMLLLMFFSLVVVLLWTIIDPQQWVRSEIDDQTHESIGECTSDHIAAFLAPLGVLVFVAAVVTGYLAWITKDIDEAFSESRWIYIMIIVQIEVLAISTPVVVLLQDVSADGRYIGQAFAFWIPSMSTLCLIMLPKYIAYHKAVRGLDQENRPRRGERIGETRVSGFTADERTGDDRQASLTALESSTVERGKDSAEQLENGEDSTKQEPPVQSQTKSK